MHLPLSSTLIHYTGACTEGLHCLIKEPKMHMKSILGLAGCGTMLAISNMVPVKCMLMSQAGDGTFKISGVHDWHRMQIPRRSLNLVSDSILRTASSAPRMLCIAGISEVSIRVFSLVFGSYCISSTSFVVMVRLLYSLSLDAEISK